MIGSEYADEPGKPLLFVAAASSGFVLLSPTYTMFKIFKYRSTGQLSILPFIAVIMNSVFWGSYDVVIDLYTMFLVSMVGVGLGVTYCTIFLTFTDRANYQKIAAFFAVLFATMALFLYLLSVIPKEKHEAFMGTVALLSMISFRISPFAVIIQVIKSKNAESMPWDLPLAAFTTSVLWLVYSAVYKPKVPMLAANVFGLLMSGTQLTLHFIYPKKPEVLSHFEAKKSHLTSQIL